MKSVLFIIGIALSTIALGQKSQVMSAQIAYDGGDLNGAYEKLQAVEVDEVVEDYPAYWKLRGIVHQDILYNEPTRFDDKMATYDIILESFTQTKKVSRFGIKQLSQKVKIAQNMCLSEGVAEFNNKRYEDAKKYFELTKGFASLVDEVDSLAIYNSALVCERLGQLNEAISHYERCIELNYRPAQMYTFIAYAYQNLGDSEKYAATVNKGVERYSNDIQLLSMKLNLLLRDGQYGACESILNNLIKNDSENGIYHFTLGTVLDYSKRYTEAEKAYKTAIKLKPDYFDAIYNLGALYFNQGVEINNASNDISDNIEYGRMKKEADAKFFNAQEYLERARSIDGTNRAVLQSLMQIYARTGDTEKFREVKELLGN